MTDGNAGKIWALIRENEASWAPGSFLRRMPGVVWTDLVEAGRLVCFRREEVLITEGAPTTEVYFLLSSYVKVMAQIQPRPGYALLAIRAGGDVMGEIAAADGGRRSATVKVCGNEPVYAVALARDDFTRAMTTHPETLMQLSRVISAKLRTSTRRRVDFSDSKPPVRLARVLLDLAEDHGQPAPGSAKAVILKVDVTQIELGTLIGVGEATAQRAMRRLRESRLINSRNSRLEIRDLAKLREFCELGARPSIDGP